LGFGAPTVPTGFLESAVFKVFNLLVRFRFTFTPFVRA